MNFFNSVDDLRRILKNKCQLEGLINSTRIRVSLGNIKTLGEVLKFLGIFPDDSRLLGESFKGREKDKVDTKQYNVLAKRILDNFIFHSLSPTQYDIDPWNNEDSYIESFPSEDAVATKISDVIIESPRILAAFSSKTHPAEHLIPEKNPKQKVFLFNYQWEPALTLFHNTLNGIQGQLLLAGTGTGKTFVYYQVIRWLIDKKFFDDKTISPWPVLILTGASVVEKTKRDGEEFFGLKHPADIYVTNFDQLRSSYGKKTMIKTELKIEEGIEHLTYNWLPLLHPCLFIIDECQKAKNEKAQQTQIITSISEIKSKQVYTIFSSATPFTRVTEAKAFVLNCRMEYDPYAVI